LNRVLLAAIALLILFPGLAVGQGPLTPVLTLTTPTTGVQLGPNQTTSATWTVSNGGMVDGTVTLSVSSLRGWRFDLAQADRSFPLAAGASRAVTVGIHTLSDSTNPVTGAVLTLSGTIQTAVQGAQGQSTSASSSIPLSYIAPIPPPPPPPPDHTLAIALAIVGALLVILAVAYLAQARQVELSTAEPEQGVARGSHVLYRVVVRNRSRRTRLVQLRVRGLALSWGGAPSFPTVPLKGRERMEVPVSIWVPIDAPLDGPAHFLVEARPNRFSPWLARQRMTATPLSPAAPGTPDAPGR
jgi:hypothetical protein